MIIIPILSLIGYAYLLSKLLKIKFTFVLPSITSLLIVFLYFCTIFKVLYFATYFTYYIGIGCLLSSILINNTQFYTTLSPILTSADELPSKTKFIGIVKWWRLIQQNLSLSPKLAFGTRQYQSELLALSLIIFLFYLYTRNAYLSAWDDFSHWGIWSKELLHYSVFEQQYLQLSSIIQSHAHYPRGSAVYHYFMLLLPGYSEGNLLFAHFLLHLIFLAPLMANKKFWQTIIIIFCILAIIVLYTTGIRSIYNDSTVGLMFGSIFAIYILEQNKHRALLLILPITALLPLFREIGLWLATFASIILIFDHLRTNKANHNNKLYFLYLIILSLPFLSNLMWVNYFKNTHDFFARTEHSFANIKLIVENFNERDRLLLLKYCQTLGKFLVKEGSLGIYILCLVSWYGIYKYNKTLAKEYLFYLIATFICYIIFILWRLYLYFVTFTYDEALRAASLVRYLGCYCIVLAIISSAYIKQTIYVVNPNTKVKFLLAILLVMSLAIVAQNMARIPQHLPQAQEIFYRQSEFVRNLLVNKLVVHFDFANKREVLDCNKLNYKLAPYFDSNSFIQCVTQVVNFNAEQQKLDFIEPIEIERILKNQQSNQYKIFYKPFMNQLYIESD